MGDDGKAGKLVVQLPVGPVLMVTELRSANSIPAVLPVIATPEFRPMNGRCRAVWG